MNLQNNDSNPTANGLSAAKNLWLPFLCGFIGTTVLFHMNRPGPTESYVSIYTEKCQAIANSPTPPEVLIVGTSRMFNGIDPRAVENELRHLGLPLSVWNLSLHNLSLAEQKQVLLDVFDRLKLTPRIVVYEPPLRLGMTLKNATTARSVYFMSVQGFRDAWSFICAADRDRLRLSYNLGSCGVFFAVGLTNYGLFSECLFPSRYLVTDHSDKKTKYLVDSKGYWPPGMAADGIVKTRAPSDLAQYETAAQEAEDTEIMKSSLSPPGHMVKIREIDSLVKMHGAVSLAVLMPKYFTGDQYYLRSDFQLSRSLRSEKDIDSIDYQSRKDHHDLYQSEMWHDFNHVSEAGADLFSRKIAYEIFRRLERVE